LSAIGCDAVNPRIAEILDRLHAIENELETELQKGRILRGFSIKGKHVNFDRATRAQHRSRRVNLVSFLRGTTFASLSTAPLIYSMIVPLLILDGWMTLYQQIYFRAFQILRVPRSEYIVIDRQHLSYLNGLEALNCMYCGYANGVIAYAREIASRTEQYWCPIKHALRVRDPHQRYQYFLEYGDAEGYRSRLTEYRKQLQDPAVKATP
jgi:hypothetical protein